MKDINKFRGCLIGGAAGDALGYAVEFMRKNEIIRQFGEDGITEYSLQNGKACISDDTQMTLFTAGAFMFKETENFPIEYMERCYQDWYLTQYVTYPVADRATHSFLLHCPELFSRRAPGMTCLTAIGSGKYGTVTNHINDSKGCGGIMRVAPIGLFYTDRKETAVQVAGYGGDAAAMTHGHELGYIPSAAFTYIIHALSRGETSVKRAVMNSIKAVREIYPVSEHMDYFCELMDTAVEYAEKDISDDKALNKLGKGWVAEETLAVAVYCALKYQNDFDRAVIVSVNHDGDSDSTGAVTGNILGTYLGYDKIPEKYKKNLELHDLIIKVADELFRRS